MSTDEAQDFDPEAPEEREIGREMVDQSTGLGSVMAHCYRGEMSRVTTWRQRLDETTKWAVMILAGLLAYGFSTSGTPAVLLAGIVVVAIFLVIEARRYQDYDIYRARVRLLQENLIANALDPSQGVEHRNWRRELSEDFRNPTLKTPYLEALSRRLRRVYLALLFVLLAAWLFRLTTFGGDGTWVSNATIGSVPGYIVIASVGAFYIGILWIAFRPHPRRSKEEFDRKEVQEGKWKDSDRE
ncbi:DUF2270 domain-containing protein [Natrinema gelatinilyticum]|uniref:DUF2270 domain-containing protein n=1 Tax=Natrinema gelatinilyticum TaxID=2961571 RepID=UPI0020C2A0B9|nr:DUF2270 domain-containing protein [Natrinema gelatinilyticum]